MINNALWGYTFFVLVATSFLTNILFGYFRNNYPKFSFHWLFWVHASVPLIIYLRIVFSMPYVLAPLWILLAVAGQMIGGRLREQTMTRGEKESLEQIPAIWSQNKRLIDHAQVAVVLMNMGGPRRIEDIQDFQYRLFSDPLLIRFPLSFLFQKIFAFLLSRARFNKTRERYMLIGGGSPIYSSTEKQAFMLKKELDRRGLKASVTYVFNYSDPTADHVIAKIKAVGKKYILPVSLYPHYSKATTGSSLHYLTCSARRQFPTANFINPPPYFLHDGYLEAFQDRIREAIKPEEDLDDFYLIFSAHSLPLYFLKEGDPYPFQVTQTVAAILQILGRKNSWCLSYQSAVGPLEWLKPSTESVLKALAGRGIKKVLIVPISFVSDHIETLWEIDIQFRSMAEKMGIEDLRMSKAIEHHPGFICALADTVESALNSVAID